MQLFRDEVAAKLGLTYIKLREFSIFISIIVALISITTTYDWLMGVSIIVIAIANPVDIYRYYKLPPSFKSSECTFTSVQIDDGVELTLHHVKWNKTLFKKYYRRCKHLPPGIWCLKEYCRP